MHSAIIGRLYAFEAGHWLPKVPEDHKCSRKHGHNYEFEVVISGPINSVGFVIDFWDLDEVVNPIIQIVDHRMLNDIEGLENPTAEYIAHWILSKISPSFTGWKISVKVFETKKCWALAKNY